MLNDIVQTIGIEIETKSCKLKYVLILLETTVPHAGGLRHAMNGTGLAPLACVVIG